MFVRQVKEKKNVTVNDKKISDMNSLMNNSDGYVNKSIIRYILAKSK